MTFFCCSSSLFVCRVGFENTNKSFNCLFLMSSSFGDSEIMCSCLWHFLGIFIYNFVSFYLIPCDLNHILYINYSWHQEEEERDANQQAQNKQKHKKTQTCFLFPNEVIAMLKGLKKKHMDKTQGKAYYKLPRRINHKATHNTSNTRTTSWGWSVV